MSILINNFGLLLTCLLEMLIGILLLVNPVGFTSGIIITCGVFTILGGIRSIFRYFRMTPEDGSISHHLLKGLVMLLAGFFCILKSKWFIITFPMLTILYGIAILIEGLYKVQRTIDFFRLKNEKWKFAAVGSVISIVCGYVILHNPFSSTKILWDFAGVYLIVESILGIVTLFFNRK